MTISLGDRMEKYTKILLAGAVSALLVVGIGYAVSLRGKAHVSDLIAQCQSENAHATRSTDKDGWETIGLICDPEQLKKLPGGLPSGGIQFKIIDAQRQENEWVEEAITLATGVMILSAIPYAWYFFLRRVRELRDAVAGK